MRYHLRPMGLLAAVLMGVIEGITEFLPVSSTAHLILAGSLLGWTSEAAKTFEIFIQLGAILAVLWLYRRRALRLLTCLWNAEERGLAFAIAVSFLPAAVAGAAFHSAIKRLLFTPLVVAVALAAGGVVILVIERFSRVRAEDDLDRVGLRRALGIGLAQCLALVPGVSRSGATILGGMALGLPRKTATEYSFFLAIPTMLAATLFDLARSYRSVGPDAVPLLAIGFAAAFVSALVVVRVFVRFVETHRFTGFAWYRIALGLGTLLFYICSK